MRELILIAVGAAILVGAALFFVVNQSDSMSEPPTGAVATPEQAASSSMPEVASDAEILAELAAIDNIDEFQDAFFRAWIAP